MSAATRTRSHEDGELDFGRWERLDAVRQRVFEAVGAHAVAARWLEPGDTDRALEEIWMEVQWDACSRTKTSGLPKELTSIEGTSESDGERRARTIGVLTKHLKWRLQDKVDVSDFRTRHSTVTLEDLASTAETGPDVEEIVIGRDMLSGFTKDALAAGPETAKFLGSSLQGAKNIPERMAIAGLEDRQYRRGRQGSLEVLAQLRQRMATILLFLVPAAVLRRMASPAEAKADTIAAVGGLGGGAVVALKVSGIAVVSTAAVAGAIQIPKISDTYKSRPTPVVSSKVDAPVQRAVQAGSVTLRSASAARQASRARAKAAATGNARRKSSKSDNAPTRKRAPSRATAARQEFSAPNASSSSSSAGSQSAPAAPAAPAVPTYTPPAPAPAAKEFSTPTAGKSAPSPAASEFK